ncbi:MAG: LacI family DNA-binding transcriptional regulator [Tepidisphaeraceae bacterium]
MSSVRQIARQVGVSPATVSRAINNHPTVAADVRQRILAAVNRTGYISAVGKRSTTNIAFLYTGGRSLGSPFDAALMQGMSDRMDEFGFDLVILTASRALLPGETFTQMFQRKGIRGAVIRTDSKTRHLVEQIAAEGFPAVVIGDRFDNPRVSSIHCDSKSTSRESVEHLLSLGHTRIGLCINSIDDSDHLDRLAGYREALEEAGVGFDERLVFRQEAWLDGGIQLARKLKAMRDRPTAMFIGDPISAIGCANESLRLGVRVPEDLSIIGFDDGKLRFMTNPQMTAIVQDAEELGREAFEVLQAAISDPEQARAENACSRRGWSCTAPPQHRPVCDGRFVGCASVLASRRFGGRLNQVTSMCPIGPGVPARWRRNETRQEERIMKSLKAIACAAIATVCAASEAQAAVVVQPLPSNPWVGYMNVFNLSNVYQWGSSWGVADLTASFSGDVLTLGPNTIGDPDPYWYTPSGGPGATGNKIMEANLYVENDALAGETVTFTGNVLSNSFVSPWTTVAFIKDFAPDYSSSVVTTVPLTPGVFSITMNTIPVAGRHVQYGFQTVGPDIWVTDAANAGFATVTAVPEPASLALLALPAVALVSRRRR